MIRNSFTTNRGQRGFTLLEMIIVITIMSTLAATYAPKLVAMKQRQEAAKEIAKNVAMLIDAAKLYHYNDPDGDGADWPTIQELRNQGYINPAWTPNHPFGGTFGLAVSGPNLRVTVSALPDDVQNIVRKSVPGWTYTAATTTGVSTIPPPGAEPSLAMKVDRSGDSMWGDLIMDNARVVIRDASGVDQLVLDQTGLCSVSASGNLSLRANTTGSQGLAIIQSKGGTNFRNASNSTVASIASDGVFKAKDAYLDDLRGGVVPLSHNRQWVVYTGIHRANELVTAPAIGGSYSKATYNIFVAPTFFEGAEGAGQPVYPVASVRCWAQKTSNSPPRWRVRMYVKDSSNRLITATLNNQRMLVIITATV